MIEYKLETVSLSKIKPNPFRRMDRYPIIQAKIDKLDASIDSTGFWANVVGRRNNGNVEIAYGHHRWQALLKKFSPGKKIQLLVGDLDDAKMLKMMADENQDEWGHLFQTEMENVWTAVMAYADKRIQFEKIKIRGKGSPEGVAKAHIRWAPGFVQGQLRG